MGWAPYPVDSGDEHPGRTEVRDDGELVAADPSARVVGLGAICGLRPPDLGDDDGRSQSFWVSEFARLASDRRVILHDDRGFTIGVGSSSGAVRDGLTPDSITRDVLNVVLPDPEDGEDHPWAWLAELARVRGLDVTAEDLRGLPYEVVLTDGLTRWLESS
jgi:hypothetical protein